MEQYVDRATAEELLLTRNPDAHYKNLSQMLLQYPQITAPVSNSSGELIPGHPAGKASNLVVEALAHLPDSAPKRVLDIGSETGRNSMYLASHGHKVVAIDTEIDNLRHTHRTSSRLGIPKDNITYVHGRFEDYDENEQFDIVVASMVLHFFSHTDRQSIVQKIRAHTSHGGLNVVASYLGTIPSEEYSHRGVLDTLSPQELQSYYTDWDAKLAYEGLHGTFVHRNIATSSSAVYIPTVEEIIAVRPPTSSLEVAYSGLSQEFMRRMDPELADTVWR